MNKSASGIRYYLPVICITFVFFTTASLIFAFILRQTDPIPVFAAFCSVFCSAYVLFAYLPKKYKNGARHFSKIFIGLTLLFVGVASRQNFQIEGFFYLVMAGFIGGPIIHFGMKVIGGLLYGRSWCSWGCWTAAVLDFLPYKTDTTWKSTLAGKIRYIHFAVSLVTIGVLFFGMQYVMSSSNTDPQQYIRESILAAYWFVAGNILYYAIGITLAFILKDNRAFCKYVCPVSVLLKLGSIFSVVRVTPISSSCSGCKKCEKVCPASIAVHSYVKTGKRVASTECFMCLNCVASCPEGNLKTGLGFDFAVKEHLRTEKN